MPKSVSQTLISLSGSRQFYKKPQKGESLVICAIHLAVNEMKIFDESKKWSGIGKARAFSR